MWPMYSKMFVLKKNYLSGNTLSNDRNGRQREKEENLAETRRTDIKELALVSRIIVYFHSMHKHIPSLKLGRIIYKVYLLIPIARLSYKLPTVFQ